MGCSRSQDRAVGCWFQSRSWSTPASGALPDRRLAAMIRPLGSAFEFRQLPAFRLQSTPPADHAIRFDTSQPVASANTFDGRLLRLAAQYGAKGSARFPLSNAVSPLRGFTGATRIFRNVNRNFAYLRSTPAAFLSPAVIFLSKVLPSQKHAAICRHACCRLILHCCVDVGLVSQSCSQPLRVGLVYRVIRR